MFAFQTVPGNIHLDLFTKNEAEEDFTSRKSNFIGSEILIKKAVETENQNIRLLIKGVPTELEYSEIEQLLANDFEGMKASKKTELN